MCVLSLRIPMESACLYAVCGTCDAGHSRQPLVDSQQFAIVDLLIDGLSVSPLTTQAERGCACALTGSGARL